MADVEVMEQAALDGAGIQLQFLYFVGTLIQSDIQLNQGQTVLGRIGAKGLAYDITLPTMKFDWATF